MDSLSPGDFGFAHTEYVMGVDSAALHFRERGKGGEELLRCNLALVKLTGRQGNKESFMLDTVSGVQRKIRFIPVHAADIVPLHTLGLGQSRRHFIRDFHKQVVMIIRVDIPQVDFLHSDTSISIWVDE